MKFSKSLIFVLASAMGLAASAAEPSGYYSSCEGKSGKTLLSQLSSVISNHTTISYSGLWDLYKVSDIDANGKIWDMYSTKRWKPGGEQCGTYSAVGDCYNREHSFPKSWFNDASPMVSDGFHIYPTDGKVNGQRSNYPYGECSGGTTLASSGGVKALGRLGKSTFPGYSGTVFEPDDEYKGDFARSYFYMAACYNSRISSWSSDMLAGNSYPAFKTWAIELLLKWHRQDPVSDKEIKRNEAVYGRQHNRNPFIDHPEMVEHIWGNKMSEGWKTGGSTPDAVFTSPVNSSSIDLGRTAINTTVSRSVTVKGANFTQAVTATVTGAGFSVSPASLTASAVNAGTTLSVNFRSSAGGAHSGTLRLTSGSASVTVNLSAETVDGIPVNDATAVTTEAFTITWTNIGSSTTEYTVNITDDDGEVAGYPKKVKAADGSLRVTGLTPNTTYTYWLTGMGLESRRLTVTTLREMPELFVDADEEPEFVTSPGVPSEDITIRVEALNAEKLSVKVGQPFEVSTDRSKWSTSLEMPADNDHFYLRLNGTVAGTYHTTVIVVADDDMVNDDLTASGTIASGEATWVESFEKILTAGYRGEELKGDAATWTFDNAGVFDEGREVYSGSHGARYNTADGGSIVMTADKRGGIGQLTFYARCWDATPATLTAEYSTDGGATWRTALKASPTTDWQQFKASVNATGGVRLRFTKNGSGRMALDDIAATGYGTGAIETTAAPRSWEAYVRNGELIIEVFTAEARRLAVYSIDGMTVADREFGLGTTALTLPAGLYIVVDNEADLSRRALVP